MDLSLPPFLSAFFTLYYRVMRNLPCKYLYYHFIIIIHPLYPPNRSIYPWTWKWKRDLKNITSGLKLAFRIGSTSTIRNIMAIIRYCQVIIRCSCVKCLCYFKWFTLFSSIFPSFFFLRKKSWEESLAVMSSLLLCWRW